MPRLLPSGTAPARACIDDCWDGTHYRASPGYSSTCWEIRTCRRRPCVRGWSDARARSVPFDHLPLMRALAGDSGPRRSMTSVGFPRRRAVDRLMPLATTFVRTRCLPGAEYRRAGDSPCLNALDEQIAAAAAALSPPALRALDAIHPASAMSIGVDLDALITYDVRLADAARAAGLTVVAPE